MNAINNETLGQVLISVGKRVKAGKCEMSQEQMDTIFHGIESAVDIPISKEDACAYLGISRATFDMRVSSGQLPEGRHRKGFKEKIWYKRELKDAKVSK